MGLHRCERNGKPGWKWGERGKCHTYTLGNKRSEARARSLALRQGRARWANARKG